MSDVTGPVSSLPGSTRPSPKGMMCDQGDDRPAVIRVQGETDSFGSEMHDLCEQCYDTLKRIMKRDRAGRCDWCKCDSSRLTNTRDYDEGMYGPVYRVCDECLRNQNEDLREELDRYYSDEYFE